MRRREAMNTSPDPVSAPGASGPHRATSQFRTHRGESGMPTSSDSWPSRQRRLRVAVAAAVAALFALAPTASASAQPVLASPSSAGAQAVALDGFIEPGQLEAL